MLSGFELYPRWVPLPLEVSKSTVEIYDYDTTQIACGRTVEEVETVLIDELRLLSRWADESKTVLNHSKTESMIDCSKPKFRRLDDENLTVRTDKGQLDSVVESKLLGIKLNKCLTWENHMAYVKGKIGERLDLLKRTQKFLSRKTRTLFYNLIIQLILSLIHSRWGEALRDDTKNGCVAD